MSKKKKKKFPQSLDIVKELAEHTKTDKLAGSLPKEIINESEVWDITTIEYQAKLYETWSCITFAILKIFQAIVFKKYGIKLNLSERLLAVGSGTTQGGNTIKAVAQWFRKNGSTLEEDCPFPATYKEWLNITNITELMKIARELIPDEYDFQYERVPKGEERWDYLKYSPLLISVPAWFEKDGKYYRPNGMRDNHATVEKKRAGVSDTYDPIEKEIDLIPTVAYRFHVEKKVKSVKIKTSLRQDFLRFLQLIGFRKYAI